MKRTNSIVSLLLLASIVHLAAAPALASIYPWRPHGDLSSCGIANGQGFIIVGGRVVCVGNPEVTGSGPAPRTASGQAVSVRIPTLRDLLSYCDTIGLDYSGKTSCRERAKDEWKKWPRILEERLDERHVQRCIASEWLPQNETQRKRGLKGFDASGARLCIGRDSAP